MKFIRSLLSRLNAKQAYRIERLPVALELTDTERVSLYGKEIADDKNPAQRTRTQTEYSPAYASENSRGKRNVDSRRSLASN